MIEHPELKQEVYSVLSSLEDAILVSGLLRILGSGDPRNLEAFTAATVFLKDGERASLKVSSKFRTRLY